MDEEDKAWGGSGGLRERLLSSGKARKTTWSDHSSYIEWDGDNIVRYNAKVLVSYGLFVVRGTVFDFRHKWMFVQVLVLFSIGILTAWWVSLHS